MSATVIPRSAATRDLLRASAHQIPFYLESRTLVACAPAPLGAWSRSERTVRATPYKMQDLRAKRADPSLRSG